MDALLLLLIIGVGVALVATMMGSKRNSGNRAAVSLADAKADARRVIERLGGQVLNLTGTDQASQQALADASERFTAASSQIDQATTAKQAMLAKESAASDWVTREILSIRDTPTIDEGNEISESEVARVRSYAQELDPQDFEALGLLLGAAHQENYSLRLTGPGGKPTARRALITEALLLACQFDIEVIKAALKHARDFDDSMTIGFAIGTLSIDQALNLRRIFEALKVDDLSVLIPLD